MKRLGRNPMSFFLSWWSIVATWCLLFLISWRQKVLGCDNLEDNQHPLKSIWLYIAWWAHIRISPSIYLFSLPMRALLGSTIFSNLRPSSASFSPSFSIRWTDTTSAYHFFSWHQGGYFVYMHAILLLVSSMLMIITIRAMIFFTSIDLLSK